METHLTNIPRYGALSSNIQNSNSGNGEPKTPSKKAATPRAAATPASRKRARKNVDVDGEGGDDEVVSASAKKVKAAVNGAVEREKEKTKGMVVKAEPGFPEDGVSDHEVSFF